MHNVFKVECYVTYVALFYCTFRYINTKTIIEQPQSTWISFFSVIIVNAMNKDQVLIQIKWLEKVQHIETAQRYTHGPLLIVTLYIKSIFLVKTRSGFRKLFINKLDNWTNFLKVLDMLFMYSWCYEKPIKHLWWSFLAKLVNGYRLF